MGASTLTDTRLRALRAVAAGGVQIDRWARIDFRGDVLGRPLIKNFNAVVWWLRDHGFVTWPAGVAGGAVTVTPAGETALAENAGRWV